MVSHGIKGYLKMKMRKLLIDKTAGHEDGLSYNVVFRLLNAADYGVPQIRQRVIIVGFRSDFNASRVFPEPTHSQDALLYSKWVSKDYWDEHGMRTPFDVPLTKAKLKAVQKSVEEGLRKSRSRSRS